MVHEHLFPVLQNQTPGDVIHAVQPAFVVQARTDPSSGAGTGDPLSCAGENHGYIRGAAPVAEIAGRGSRINMGRTGVRRQPADIKMFALPVDLEKFRFAPMEEIFAGDFGKGTQPRQSVSGFPNPDIHDVTLFAFRIEDGILGIQHMSAGLLGFISDNGVVPIRFPVDAVRRIIGEKPVGFPHAGDRLVASLRFAVRIGVVKRHEIVGYHFFPVEQRIDGDRFSGKPVQCGQFPLDAVGAPGYADEFSWMIVVSGAPINAVVSPVKEPILLRVFQKGQIVPAGLARIAGQFLRKMRFQTDIARFLNQKFVNEKFPFPGYIISTFQFPIFSGSSQGQYHCHSGKNFFPAHLFFHTVLLLFGWVIWQ